jgi:transcriptional regulator with XRE-family HTH domain
VRYVAANDVRGGLVPPASQIRHELARFLRIRREQITPAQVGLPASTRRRTQGLRREEVAVLAGVSPTWYTYLEQGREIQPSPEVLDSLARVLRLTEDERQYIHQLALGHVKNTNPVVSQETIIPLVKNLVQVAGQCPYPLFAFDYAGTVIAWNDIATQWYTDWNALHDIECNIVWWMLMNPQARERIADWEEDARNIVATTRALSARYPHDQQVRELIARLNEECDEFRKWWPNHEVRGQRSRTRRFRLNGHGIRTMRLVVAHPADALNVTMAFHVPDILAEEP